jgi:hypothetical protein
MKHSIYGLNYSPRLWWEHILKALKELGLKPSKHNQCLFYTKDLMIVLYVDDAGIVVPMVELINVFIDGLMVKGFKLTKQGASVSFWELSLRKIPWLDPSPPLKWDSSKRLLQQRKWKIAIPTGYQLPRRHSELILKANLWKRTGVTGPSSECCCISRPT